MSRRSTDARIHREYQEFIEALAAVNVDLFAAVARDDEATYNDIYESRFQPIHLAALKTLGSELAHAACRHAGTLARLAA
jgi:hypothetical protein